MISGMHSIWEAKRKIVLADRKQAAADAKAATLAKAKADQEGFYTARKDAFTKAQAANR